MHWESFSAAVRRTGINGSLPGNSFGAMGPRDLSSGYGRSATASKLADSGTTPPPSLLRGLFEWIRTLSRRVFPAHEPRRLRLCETLSLGNRGYVAVVRYHEHRFLVGGTSGSIVLLAEIKKSTGSENESRTPE